MTAAAPRAHARGRAGARLAGLALRLGPGLALVLSLVALQPAPAWAQATPGAAPTLTVGAGDTATALAQKLRPEAATLEQTLVALWRANPTAGGYDRQDAVTYVWLGQALLMTIALWGGGSTDDLGDKFTELFAVDWGTAFYTAAPVKTEDGRLAGVIVAGTTLERLLDRLSREAQASLTVYDRNGKVVATSLPIAEAVLAYQNGGPEPPNIDVDAATERGVIVMNTPSGNTIATAELTFTHLLSLARPVPEAVQSMREGKWDRKTLSGSELFGKTLGVLGLEQAAHINVRRQGQLHQNAMDLGVGIEPGNAIQDLLFGHITGKGVQFVQAHASPVELAQGDDDGFGFRGAAGEVAPQHQGCVASH